MKDLSTYAFINAKVRAMLSRLLSNAQLEKLINAENSYDAVLVLENSPYAAIVQQDIVSKEGIEAVEKEFIKYDIDIHKKIIKNLSGSARKLIELLMQRYELDEIKAVLRIWNKQTEPEAARYLIRDTISCPIDIDNILSAQTIEDIIFILDDTPYKKPILNAREKYKHTNSLFYIEVSLDKDYFFRVWQEVDKLPKKDRNIASKLLGIEIDIENISQMIRLKQYFNLPSGEALKMVIPYGFRITTDLARKVFMADGIKTMIEGLAVKPYDGLSALFGKNIGHSQLYMMESVLYQILFKESKASLGRFPFNIGTVLSYLFLKRAETRNIISILYSKSYGLNPERIRGSLLC